MKTRAPDVTACLRDCEIDRISTARDDTASDVAIGDCSDRFPSISVSHDWNVAAVVIRHQSRDASRM